MRKFSASYWFGILWILTKFQLIWITFIFWLATIRQITVSNVLRPNPLNYKQTLLNIPKFGVDFFAVLKREISNASLFSSSLFCWITNNLLLSSLFLALLLPPLTGDSDSLVRSLCDMDSWVMRDDSHDSSHLKLTTCYTNDQKYRSCKWHCCYSK